MKNVVYIKNLNPIGGTESFVYYLTKKYQDHDITVFYKTGDEKQIDRLKKQVRVRRYIGQQIKCEKIFVNYTTDILETVEAKEYIQIIHTDFKEQGLIFRRHPKITKYLGVTQIVCDSFKKYTGLDCELCYNPIIIDKQKRVLNLVSATRLTKEKGADRMVKLANALDSEGIPFLWLVFTDNLGKIQHPNIVCIPCKLDIFKYLANADYLVQLSDKGEGYGYTPAESLMLGTPVITTPCPAFLEIGIKDRENGFVLDYDMKDIPVKEIYKGLPKFKYEPPKDRWGELLEEGKSTYKEDYKKMVEVQCIKKYNDIELGCLKTPNDKPYKVNINRAEYLADRGLVKYFEY